MTKRISMWSGPRNISTAIMYSFRERSDTQVVDEPLYAHYLSTTNVRHPGDDEVVATMENDGAKVVSEILLGDVETEVVFFKNMAHHLRGLETGFLSRLENILLTRHPVDMLTSLVKQLPDPCLRDTGLKEQTEVLEHLLNLGQEPIVIDSQELLKTPESVLRQLCEKLSLPFESSMLSWQAGPKPEDGVWAKHWYDNVHKSTGFAPYRPKEAGVPRRLEGLLEECLEHYNRLLPYAIKAKE